jgi:hypothetical protein
MLFLKYNNPTTRSVEECPTLTWDIENEWHFCCLQYCEHGSPCRGLQEKQLAGCCCEPGSLGGGRGPAAAGRRHHSISSRDADLYL